MAKINNNEHSKLVINICRGNDAVSMTWLLKMRGSRIKNMTKTDVIN